MSWSFMAEVSWRSGRDVKSREKCTRGFGKSEFVLK